MKYWSWRVYTALSLTLLSFAAGRLAAGVVDPLVGVAVVGGVFQASNAWLQYRRPR